MTYFVGPYFSWRRFCREWKIDPRGDLTTRRVHRVEDAQRIVVGPADRLLIVPYKPYAEVAAILRRKFADRDGRELPGEFDPPPAA